MDSIFTKIIKGEIPCHKVAEDDMNFAFLDISPSTKGHTLVIPKKQVDKLFDLNVEEYQSLMNFSYRVAKAQEQAISCQRIGLSVVGLEVPHAHIHLIPINNMSDMQFMKKAKCTEEEFKNIAIAIGTYFK